jgi:hypothetical protein
VYCTERQSRISDWECQLITEETHVIWGLIHRIFSGDWIIPVEVGAGEIWECEKGVYWTEGLYRLTDSDCQSITSEEWRIQSLIGAAITNYGRTSNW